MNEADRLFYPTHFVTAFLRQALEPFVSGQRDIEQRCLPPDCREITGCQGIQLIQRGPGVGLVSAAQPLELRPKQLPALLGLQVVKLDLEREAAQGRGIEALHQISRTDEQAIETLEKDREKLVATEKMAALGSLVAGVAHELNTPIGNGLLAATTLLDSTRILAEKFASGLSRSTLTSYLADAADGAEMLERNLHRAADLINSFKQIAIDQSSTQVRRFSLATVVSEVLLTLMPTLKKTPFTVTQSVPDTIVLDSYPGPLEQVLINLINNAVIHGLSGCASGQISISACLPDSDRVQLVVEDNGKGIPDEQLQKVFTPFYTTKADAGGSGLGLSITHSIVTGLLGGEIKLTSTVGAGTRFCITIPLAAKSR